MCQPPVAPAQQSDDGTHFEEPLASTDEDCSQVSEAGLEFDVCDDDTVAGSATGGAAAGGAASAAAEEGSTQEDSSTSRSGRSSGSSSSEQGEEGRIITANRPAQIAGGKERQVVINGFVL